MKATLIANNDNIYVVHEQNGKVSAHYKRIYDVIENGVRAEVQSTHPSFSETYKNAVVSIVISQRATVIKKFDEGHTTLSHIANYITQWTIKNHAGWWNGGEINGS